MKYVWRATQTLLVITTLQKNDTVSQENPRYLTCPLQAGMSRITVLQMIRFMVCPFLKPLDSSPQWKEPSPISLAQRRRPSTTWPFFPSSSHYYLPQLLCAPGRSAHASFTLQSFHPSFSTRYNNFTWLIFQSQTRMPSDWEILLIALISMSPELYSYLYRALTPL